MDQSPVTRRHGHGQVDGHGKTYPIKQQIFGLRYATGNLPQCAVLNAARIPLAPFNAITIAPACKLAAL